MLSLSARGVAGIGDAVAVHRPNLVVLAGGHLGDDAVARWAYAVRLAAGADASRGLSARRSARASTHGRPGPSVLPSGAGEAQQRLLELVEADSGEQAVALSAQAPTAAKYAGRRSDSEHVELQGNYRRRKD